MSTKGFEAVLTAIEPDPKPAIDAHTKVRERLASHEKFKKVHVDTFLAGSYRRRTARAPIKDVDVVVMVDRELHGWQPADVLEFLDKTLADYEDYKRRRRANRRSIQVSLPQIDMDIVPTVALYGPDSELRIPDRDVKQWMRTHPKGHIKWVQDLNGATVKIGSQGTLVPLVKLIKQWKVTCFGGARHPKGFILETLAGYLHDPTADSWEEVFTRFLEQFLSKYSGWKSLGLVPCLPDPGLAGESIKTGMMSADFDRLITQAQQAVIIARQAIKLEEEGNERGAAVLWQRLFGDVYPIPKEENTIKSAPAVATPFSRPDIRQAPRFG
jgi:SMODS domain-containing protein